MNSGGLVALGAWKVDAPGAWSYAGSKRGFGFGRAAWVHGPQVSGGVVLVVALLDGVTDHQVEVLVGVPQPLEVVLGSGEDGDRFGRDEARVAEPVVDQAHLAGERPGTDRGDRGVAAGDQSSPARTT